MGMKSPQKNRPVYILVAPGFEEDTVVNFLVRLREVGIGTALVGLTGNDVVGAHGVAMQVDLRIDEALRLPPQILILPQTESQTPIYQIDPRVSLLKELSGKVMTADNVSTFLNESGNPRLIIQE